MAPSNIEVEFGDGVDEAYFEDRSRQPSRSFDAKILREPVSVLPLLRPVVFSADGVVSEAMRAMQREHSRCVVVTADGTRDSELTGIFTDRDVLFRIVDRGRNPAVLPLGKVMTRDPEVLHLNSTVAYVLNRMAIDRFQTLPVVDDERHPVFVISVREVVAFLVETFPREVLNLPAEHGSRAQRAREGA